MSKEKKILVVTMVLNFVVASIKLVSGIMFNFSTLIADSLQSFSDFITDVISSFASKIGDKRANKRHPFGYGMIENISNLFMGVMLLLLGIYIFYEAFHAGDVVIKPIVFLVLGIVITLKVIIVVTLYDNGKKLKSNVLLVSAKESALDLVASIVVFIVSLLLLFKDKYPVLAYADSVGSILISILIFKISINIIRENVDYLLGVNEDDKVIIDKVKEIINNSILIKDSSIKLMKNGDYYNLYLTIEIDSNISLKQLFRLENRLKTKIRKLRLKIRYITIEPVEYR